jgi:hypothetical protein
VQPPASSYFSGVLQGHLILLCHRRPNRWIFDTGCTAHSAYLHEMFISLQPHDEPMYAANGALMPIGGLGTAGPFSNVLFLPDLRVNLFSQKQAMHDGWKIILSPDARVFTVVVPPNRVLKTTNYQLRTTNYEIRIPHYELRTTNYELRTTNDERRRTTNNDLRTTNYELRRTTKNYEALRTKNEIRTTNDDLRTANYDEQRKTKNNALRAAKNYELRTMKNYDLRTSNYELPNTNYKLRRTTK